MRRLTQAQVRDLAEYVRDMAAIKRDREKGNSRSQSPARPLFGRLPESSPSRRPAPPPRRVGFADGSPHLVCRICLEPAHVGRSWTCSRCAAEIAWRVSLARQGLKIVS